VSGTQVFALVLVLYLVYEAGAIALGVAVGQRVGLVRRTLIVCAVVALGYLALTSWPALTA
jgi:hypothetical protein